MQHLGKLILSTTLLTGCMTAEHLGNVGDAYSQGDLLFGSAMLIGTPIHMMADVFTLGGSLTPEESLETWEGVARTYQEYEQGKALRSSQAGAASNLPASGGAQNAGGHAAGGASRLSEPSTQCVRIDPLSADQYGSYYTLVNTCSKSISVTHCYDDYAGLGPCTTRGAWWGGHQGNGDLTPGASTKSVKVPAGKAIHVRACEIPPGARWVDVRRTSDNGGYVCAILQ